MLDFHIQNWCLKNCSCFIIWGQGQYWSLGSYHMLMTRFRCNNSLLRRPYPGKLTNQNMFWKVEGSFERFFYQEIHRSNFDKLLNKFLLPRIGLTFSLGRNELLEICYFQRQRGRGRRIEASSIDHDGILTLAAMKKANRKTNKFAIPFLQNLIFIHG